MWWFFGNFRYFKKVRGLGSVSFQSPISRDLDYFEIFLSSEKKLAGSIFARIKLGNDNNRVFDYTFIVSIFLVAVFDYIDLRNRKL